MINTKDSLWLLGLTTLGTVCVIGIFNYKFNQWMKKQVNKIKKDNQIDILNKNRLLTFGVSSDQCVGHMKREFDCGNLDCNYGRLRYWKICSCFEFFILIYIEFLLLNEALH